MVLGSLGVFLALEVTERDDKRQRGEVKAVESPEDGSVEARVDGAAGRGSVVHEHGDNKDREGDCGDEPDCGQRPRHTS